jgi:transposase
MSQSPLVTTQFADDMFRGFETRHDSERASTERKKRARRVFSAAQKLRILQEAASSTKRGDIEALLQREAIYSSHLAAWRKQLALRGTQGLEGAKPGRKPKLDARDHRIRELERRVAFLERELERVGGEAHYPAALLDRVEGL